ncbi:MAG: SRPBCC domain-containing protein [Minicystis sp.]
MRTGNGIATAPRRSWSDIHIVRDYPHPPEKIWRLLTDPALIPRWTATGKGGQPVGFAPVVGVRFKFIAKPMPGWNGIVDCEVLEVREPFLLRYTWLGGEEDDRTIVTNRLEPRDGGTRFTWEHTGFTGIGGLLVSRVLDRVRTKMLDVGFPAVLDALDEEENHR